MVVGGSAVADERAARSAILSPGFRFARPFIDRIECIDCNRSMSWSVPVSRSTQSSGSDLLAVKRNDCILHMLQVDRVL
jgi:hypothetical protein